MQGSILISDEIEELFGAAIEAQAPGTPHVVVHPDRVEGDPASAEIAFFSNELFPDRTGEIIRPVIASTKPNTNITPTPASTRTRCSWSSNFS